MADQTSFLPAGPQPQIGPEVHVIGVIGRVGDGIVYAARDGLRQARLREYAPVGLTRRAPDRSLRPREEWFERAWRDGSERFLEQGQRLASLHHPGVAPVWRAAPAVVDGAPHGATLIGAPVGESLAAALAAGLQIPPFGVVRLAQDLAGALAAVHASGITHLDIAPDSVSLATGHVQLSDFTVDNRPFMPLLESQEGLVRPCYSPIEQHDGSRAEPLGPPADVYAACALIFRLITGRPPARWEERWRDPTASQLADRDAYPPDFIAAVRSGLAIEPDDRWRDGQAWLEAMAAAAPPSPAASPATLAPVGLAAAAAAAAPVILEKPAEPMAAPSVAGPAPTDAPLATAVKASSAKWVLPSVLTLLLLVAASALGLYGYGQGWFDSEADAPATANRSVDRPVARRTAPATPDIAVGGTVAGQLGSRDRRLDGGEFEDRYALRGRAGQKLDIRLNSDDFDPVLSITGPGLTAENDDDEGQDSRLVVSLPQDGTYTIAARSYAAAARGGYTLEVAEAIDDVETVSGGGGGAGPPPITPALLGGRWRLEADQRCADPAIIDVDGAALTYRRRGVIFREQILDGTGRTIRTRIVGGPSNDAEFEFLLSPDGRSFEVRSEPAGPTRENERWVRC